MTIRESIRSTEKSFPLSTPSQKGQGESRTSTGRRTAIIVGVFYIAATVAGILSVVFMPDLASPLSFTNLAASQSQVFAAALLEFTMAVLVAGIAIAMYPILKLHDETLAIGYVVARSVEGIIFTIGVVSLLTLLTVGQEAVAAGVADADFPQILGAQLLAVREWGGAVFSVMVFSMSALILNYLLYRSRLVPRWLSGWGLIGAMLYLASGFLPLIGYGSESTIFVLAELPLGLQEMVLAIWLIAKGFNASAIPTGTA